ncbi:phage tail protein [Acinetobacter stercoris]|nr:phage tail protein [Acinetobacter stercoris]
MSNEKFIWENSLDGNSTTQSFNVLSSKFGDGYEQHVSVGINNRKGQWAYSRTGYSAEIKQIKAFLDRHKGADSFLWDAPLEGEVRVKADVQYQLTNIGADVWQISTTFYQQF